jgi:hypothetical protein
LWHLKCHKRWVKKHVYQAGKVFFSYVRDEHKKMKKGKKIESNSSSNLEDDDDQEQASTTS